MTTSTDLSDESGKALISDTLRMFVGQGRRFSWADLANATGDDERKLRSYVETDPPAMPSPVFMRVFAVLPPEAFGRVCHRMGFGAPATAEADTGTTVRRAAARAARLVANASEALEDGIITPSERANLADEAADSAPSFGKHRGQYAFPLSDEWKVWMASNGSKNAMKMGAFAEFLEDRIVDVLYLIPGEDEISDELQKFINTCGGSIATPQKLIELSRGLQVYENCAVKEAVRLQSGEGSVSFDVTHTDADGRPLSIPGLFLIAIPVFKGGIPYRIAARLRYRKTQEGIVFWYDLWRTDQTFDHAFLEACEQFKAATDVPLMLGKPE
jgi:hypothetical protein